GAAGGRDRLDRFMGFGFRLSWDGRAAAAALDRVVLDPVAGVDHVFAAVADEDVFAGLAEHRVRLGVADQGVGAEGALHVLVGRRKVHAVAAGDRRDPGGVRGEADDQAAGVVAGLGEGGVVAAAAADQRPARATSARCQQVAAGAAVEEGRAGSAADQAVGARAAVKPVGPGTGLEEVVLGAAADHVVAEAAGDADEADRDQRAFDEEVIVARAAVDHQPAGGAVERAFDSL